MAYVTPIGGDPGQVEYRLAGRHGCPDQGHEAQFSYHVDGRERPLVWTGAGLGEVGLAAGAVLEEGQFGAARALMAGLDPRTGEVLVAPKQAVWEDAKVPTAALVAAVREQAAAGGVEPAELFASSVKLGAAWQRAERSLLGRGGAARLRADEAGTLADRAGLDVEAVWGPDVHARAVGNLTETRQVVGADGVQQEQLVPRRRTLGNMGYDVSFTLPKSMSLLLAFADEDTAAKVEQVYSSRVGDTFDWLEQQTAYGMRGHHGDGRTAQVTRGSGFLGWSMVHRAARPVGDRVVGDPHWHVHVTIANMTRGRDGGWSTVAAGGRDLMRHAPAADHVLKALVRRTLSEQFGVAFARSERTGGWEVAAIPDATLRAFSRRGASIEAMLRDLGFDPALATRRAEDLAAAQSRQGKTHTSSAPDATLRQMWQAQAREQHIDPDALAAAALGGPAAGRDGQPQVAADGQERLLADVVARLLDPERGLTSDRRRFSRVDALAAVADALPAGAGDVTEIEQLCDRALADAGFLALPDRSRTRPAATTALEQQAAPSPEAFEAPAGGRRQLGAPHMANTSRWTTVDVVAAEQVILRAAAASQPGQGYAHVDPNTAALACGTVEVGQGFALSAEQVRVVDELVTSDRALEAILGPPGTGKTTLLRAARAGWEADGLVVAGTATAAVAAQNLQAESGIDSKTVAQWTHRIRSGQGLAGVDVLVLDEANLTDDRDRALLYEAARRSRTKLVEVGDPQQLRGVGCGSLFRRVHQVVQGGCLTENRRQRDEDERRAIAAWREGRYSEALGSWSHRGRLVATETGDQAVSAMVATWLQQRAGAPDAHEEIRGLVMLAGSNEAVDRLNDAAQAVRQAAGELGPARDYALRGGRTVRLAQGDHVMIRLNDRAQRAHEGPDVLNGYRGVVEGIRPDGTVQVGWQQDGPDGRVTQQAALSPAYIAGGGLSLGYAMTVHKAEGLTVGADWTSPQGVHQGGTVLVLAAGLDEPALHVATSRHRDRAVLFAGREQLESAQDLWDKGTPADGVDLQQRVVDALADQASGRPADRNDRPVVDDLQRGRFRPLPGAASPVVRQDDAAGRRRSLQGQDPAAGRRPEKQDSELRQERSMSRYSFDSGEDRWHVGWDPAVASHYAQVEPVRTPPGADDSETLRTIAGDRTGEVPTLAALEARLADHVRLPAGVREQLADDGPAQPAVAAQRAKSRLDAMARLVGPEEHPQPAAPPATKVVTSGDTAGEQPAAAPPPAGSRSLSAKLAARRARAAAAPPPATAGPEPSAERAPRSVHPRHGPHLQ